MGGEVGRVGGETAGGCGVDVSEAIQVVVRGTPEEGGVSGG